MKTAKEIVNQVISVIEPLKIKPAKTKAEKFVNVGIEATKRLFEDNKAVRENEIKSYAREVAEAVRDECSRATDIVIIIDINQFIK